MLVKSITFKDYNGGERTEDYYFNLNKAEVIKWLTTTGDYTLDAVIERLSKEHNGSKIMEMFENLIRMSYGRKSLDGIRFEKSDEIWKDFYHTEAYSNLFVELVTDAKAASSFVNSIIPQDLADEVQKIMNNNPDGFSSNGGE